MQKKYIYYKAIKIPSPIKEKKEEPFEKKFLEKLKKRMDQYKNQKNR